VDRHAAMRDGCSFGNAGMIVPSHFVPLAAPGMVALGLKWMWNPESPFYIKPRLNSALVGWGYRFWRAATPEHVRRTAPLLRDLSLASRAAFEEISAGSGPGFGLTQRGLLMLCNTDRGLDEENHNANRANELGIPAEVLTRDQVAALDPAITMKVLGGVYFPKDCHLSPDRFMSTLQSHLGQAGTQFHWNTEVQAGRRQGNRVSALQIRTSTGQAQEIVADEFVLCAGSWSTQLARGLDLSLPMQAGKGYSLTLREPRQLPGLCAILSEARVAVTPMGDNLRFGGTMELAGLDETINPVRVRGIINSVLRYYPRFKEADFASVQPWCGLRPCSPDGLPYLGRTTKFSNLTIATGHAMMGLSLGPVTGQLVAEVISGERSTHDLSLLSPDRFG